MPGSRLAIRLTVALSIAAIALGGIDVAYATSVRRGAMGMRNEWPWEVAATGNCPFRTRVYAEQRMPAYAGPGRLLSSVLDVVHSLDVWVRWEYWHEVDVPAFDDPPEFQITSS
jgi:hypothetical protein